MPHFEKVNVDRPYVGKDYVKAGYLLLLKEESWNKIAKSARWAIKKARKMGITIMETRDPAKFNDKFFPKKLKKNQICFLALNREGKPTAGVILERQFSNIVYKYGGSNKEGKESQANSLLLWESVLRFSGNKYKYLDVGSSFRFELDHFKSQFATDTYPIIFNPPRLTPQIRLEPYYNDFVKINDYNTYQEELPKSMNEYFGNRHTILPDGRTAIYAILKKIGLHKNDVVTIFTTFGTPYVARDVTDTIQLICKYSRKIEPNTKVLYIIHEWGFPIQDVKNIIKIAKEKKILVIEDCAHSLTSSIDGQRIGTWGDYSIYSLPKIFPCQYGGILTGISLDNNEQTAIKVLDIAKREKLLKTLGRDLKHSEEYAVSRRQNFLYLKEGFEKFGLIPLVQLTDNVVPHAYLLQINAPYRIVRLLRKFGVEAGVYHKSKAILLPVHQNLSQNHLDYILAVVKSYYSW